jgi:UDP-glucose 4-epimerase
VSDRYLVTGGAGFIGSNVVDELLARGNRVRVLDNFSTGRRENIAHVQGDIELLEGDIRSYERAQNACKGCDYVIHLAALPSVPRSIQDPLTTDAVNATGTLNVLLAARDAGVRRVVLASSSSVYGANATLPKREDLVLLPISPYGVSKLAAERYACAFHHVYGLETAALRYFNVFGPRQDPNSQYSAVIPRFITRGIRGEAVMVFGDGSQTRDFTYVENVVNFTLGACLSDGVSGCAFNVGCGERHSLSDVIEIIGGLVGAGLEIEYAEPRDGDIKDSWADVSAIVDATGIHPTIGLEAGLRLTFNHLAGRE